MVPGVLCVLLSYLVVYAVEVEVVKSPFAVQGGKAYVFLLVFVDEVVQRLYGICGGFALPPLVHARAKQSEVCQFGHYHPFQDFRQYGLELDWPPAFCMSIGVLFCLPYENCGTCFPAVWHSFTVCFVPHSQEEVFFYFPEFSDGSCGDVIRSGCCSIG